MKFIKSLCSQLPKSKIKEMCDLMDCCDWERELLIDWLCQPKTKTLLTFEYNDEKNYKKRLINLEIRVRNFLKLSDFIPKNMIKDIEKSIL